VACRASTSRPVNVGDQVTVGDVKAHVVPAMHSSEPSGRPVGYVLESGLRRL
jgi:L-ascorbate metabolism protein UlaG (beta-lactamase superfamily)